MAIDLETLMRWEQERQTLREFRRDESLYRNGSIFINTTVEGYMAEKKPTKATAPEPDEQPVEKAITCTPQVSQDPMTVLVVGAGGNGARIIPPLTQMLRRRDRLFIMDNDIVEDRNLARQHFTERDIGQPKALVLANRYQKRDLRPTALVTQLVPGNVSSTLTGLEFTGARNSLVIVGCVDNNNTRKSLNQMLSDVSIGSRVQHTAYIDVGNERRGGQVLLSLRAWPLLVNELGGTNPGRPLNYNMPTMTEAMPQLMRPTPWNCDECAVSNPSDAKTCSKCGREQGSCGNRIDLQTVMVNHMSAGMVINCLSWLMLGIPFSSAGSFFSTLNSIQPIKIKAVNHNAYKLTPDTNYAEK